MLRVSEEKKLDIYLKVIYEESFLKIKNKRFHQSGRKYIPRTEKGKIDLYFVKVLWRQRTLRLKIKSYNLSDIKDYQQGKCNQIPDNFSAAKMDTRKEQQYTKSTK